MALIDVHGLGDVQVALDRHEAILNGGSMPVPAGNSGVVMDAETVSDAAMSSGSAVLTSATGLFQVADVGKLILVSGGAAASADLVTTIASYQSATQVTLTAANASGGAISAKTISWGTDNTTAINNALAAVTPTTVGGRKTGGGTLQFAVGSCMTQGPHTWPQNCEIAGWGEQATNIIHVGNNACFTHAPTTFGDYNRPVLRDLTLWGSGVGSSAVGVQLGGKQQGASLERVVIGNYTNGVGLLLWTQNSGDFVEGVTCYKLNLRFNLVGEEIRRTSGNASFAYQRRIDYSNIVPANGIGLLIGDDTNSSAQCQVYHGYWRGNIQLEGNNAVGVKIGSHGWVPGDTVWLMQGENPAANTGVKSLQINSGGIFYPRGIHDFGIDGFQNQPTMDVANATTYRPPARRDERLSAQGLVAETFPRVDGQGSTAPTAGNAVGALLDLRRGDVLAGLAVTVNANGATLTLTKAAIWSVDGLTQYAVSADNSAAFTSGTVPRSVQTAFTSAWTVPADGAYYAVILFVGTTPATLLRSGGVGAISTKVGTGAFAVAQSQNALTDMPVSITWQALGVGYWLAAY